MAEEDEILRKFAGVKAQYDAYQQKLKRSRQLYALDIKEEVLPSGARARGFMAVVPRTAMRNIDEAADHILYVPKVRVPVRPTQSELVTQQEIAEKKRKAIQAWWRQITQRFNPIGDGRKWLLLDGMLAIKQTVRWDLIPDEDDPEYQRALKNLGKYEFLWDVQILDAAGVYPDLVDHRNPRYTFWEASITKEHAQRLFPRTLGNGNTGWRRAYRSDYQKLRYMEYWTAPEWNADGTYEPGAYRIYVENECVHDADNPYPYIPIAVEDSGYGLNRMGALPEERFVGMLTGSDTMYVAQGRQWTTMQAVAEITGFNPMIARNMSAEKLSKLKLGAGEIWDLEGNPNTDENAEFLEMQKWPDIPIIVPQIIGMIDREVNSALKSDILGGIPQKGVDTASEVDQNVRNGMAKLQFPVGGLERIAAKMTRWFLMAIEHCIEAPVTLYGSGPDDPADITLSPREISGYYDCFVQLRTTDEEAADMTRARFWGELYRVLPMLSAWTAMEAGGISDDPLAEMIRRAGEDVFLSEEFRQIRVATGMQSFGELAQLLQQMGQQKAGGKQPAGAASDLSLITQDDVNSPVQARVVSDALMQRDTNQAASMIRGPQGASYQQ